MTSFRYAPYMGQQSYSPWGQPMNAAMEFGQNYGNDVYKPLGSDSIGGFSKADVMRIGNAMGYSGPYEGGAFEQWKDQTGRRGEYDQNVANWVSGYQKQQEQPAAYRPGFGFGQGMGALPIYGGYGADPGSLNSTLGQLNNTLSMFTPGGGAFGNYDFGFGGSYSPYGGGGQQPYSFNSYGALPMYGQPYDNRGAFAF